MEILWKYKGMLAYLFFGICTTVVNLIVYCFCTRIMSLLISVSIVIAWFLAVVFAFITNKMWVFESKSWKKEIVKKELSSFLLCRVATGIMDLVIMLITVDIFLWNDVVMKVISNVLVIFLNYITSRLIIFKKND